MKVEGARTRRWWIGNGDDGSVEDGGWVVGG
jgi:hypothetical protein